MIILFFIFLISIIKLCFKTNWEISFETEETIQRRLIWSFCNRVLNILTQRMREFFVLIFMIEIFIFTYKNIVNLKVQLFSLISLMIGISFSFISIIYMKRTLYPATEGLKIFKDQYIYLYKGINLRNGSHYHFL